MATLDELKASLDEDAKVAAERGSDPRMSELQSSLEADREAIPPLTTIGENLALAGDSLLFDMGHRIAALPAAHSPVVRPYDERQNRYFDALEEHQEKTPLATGMGHSRPRHGRIGHWGRDWDWPRAGVQFIPKGANWLTRALKSIRPCRRRNRWRTVSWF